MNRSSLTECSSGSNKTTSKMIMHARVVTGTGGGPEKTILNSPRFLAQHGYDSACLYLHPPEDQGVESLKQKAKQLNAEFISVPDGGLFDLSVVRKLLKICKERRVSIWHAHDYKTNALGVLLRRFHRMKLVTTVHGWVNHTHKTPLYYWIDKQSLRFYERVICVSQDLHDACLTHGVKPEKCTVIQNAIDTDDFQRNATQTEAKELLSISSERTLIGAVGRLANEKAFHLLISACENLMDLGFAIELAIIGEGGKREELEQQIANTKHQARFHLLGFQAETIPFYEAMDMFVLSSFREGLPNVLLEAMAMEVPVVSTNIAGIPNLITDGIHGLLVEPGSVAELQRAIQKLLQDEALKKRLIQNARNRIESEYSFTHRMSKVSDIYDQLLTSDH